MADNHFTTDAKFEEKIKKLAADHNLTLTAVDSIIALRRLDESYNEILGALMARGLTVAQIDLWDRGEEFQLDIATFWYCKDSGWGGKNVDEEDWTTVFDRRKELKKIPITANSVLIESPAVAVGMDLLSVNRNLGIYP